MSVILISKAALTLLKALKRASLIHFLSGFKGVVYNIYDVFVMIPFHISDSAMVVLPFEFARYLFLATVL